MDVGRALKAGGFSPAEITKILADVRRKNRRRSSRQISPPLTQEYRDLIAKFLSAKPGDSRTFCLDKEFYKRRQKLTGYKQLRMVKEILSRKQVHPKS